jgi:putative ABC transport system permease protein
MKLRDIIFSANTNLVRNKVRTILTIVAIFIGTFTLSLVVGVNIGVTDYANDMIKDAGSPNMLIIQKSIDASAMMGQKVVEYDPDQGTQDMALPKNAMEDVKKIKNIENAMYYEQIGIEYVEGDNGIKYQIGVQSLRNVTAGIAKGKDLDFDSKEPQILLGEPFVKPLGYTMDSIIGKNIKLAVKNNATGKLNTVSAKVVGIRKDNFISMGEAFINKSLNDKLIPLAYDGVPKELLSKLAITATVKGELTDAKVNTIKADLIKMGLMAQTVEDQIKSVMAVLNALTIGLGIFAAIALLAASFGIINTLYMSVSERTREIGLMKSMGMSGAKIFGIFSTEAIFIGFWGAFLGVLGSFGVGTVLNNVATDTFLKDIKGLTLVQWSAPAVLGIMLLIMLIAFLAGTLPAKKASGLDPIDALRYE